MVSQTPGGGMFGPVQQYCRLVPVGLMTVSTSESRSHRGPLDVSTGTDGSGWMVKLVARVSEPQLLLATKNTVCGPSCPTPLPGGLENSDKGSTLSRYHFSVNPDALQAGACPVGAKNRVSHTSFMGSIT